MDCEARVFDNRGRVRRASIGLSLLALAVVGGNTAAAQPAVSRLVVSGVTVQGNEATAAVSALDAGGTPITGLSQGAFTVQLDGQPAQVLGVASGVDAALPIALVIVVDTSGSMAGAPIAAAKQAVKPMAQSLQPGDRATLVAFASAVNTVVPFTADTTQLSAGVDSLVAQGNTALYSAVAQAVAIASTATEPRKAIVLLSDGEDFGAASTVTRAEALAAAANGGVPFFVVGLGAGADQTFLSGLNQNGAGEVLFAAGATELGQLYTRISGRLRVQYTVRFALPASLPAGDHKVRVAAGSAFGEAGFTTSRSVTGAFAGLEGELAEETVVRLTGAPSTARATFSLDGQPVPTEADGLSVRLDPYQLDPGREHVLGATYRDGSKVQVLEQRFAVRRLPSRLISPPGEVRANDFVRLSVQSQPGAGTPLLRYLVDGEEFERDSGAPYEFVLPASYKGGRHRLAIVAEDSHGRSEKTYEFETSGGGGPNPAAWAIVGLAALAALGAFGYAGALAVGRWRDRDRPLDLSGVSDKLSVWARNRRGGRAERAPAEAAPVAAAAAPWGWLAVLEGKDRGRRFPLKDEVELVGRGKSCSVRLKDKGVDVAHFLLRNDGQFQASTPAAQLEKDGQPVRSGRLEPGEQLRLGGTVLRLER